uniref:Uncharacterized protein n=1 Tax=Glossina brevipalpis TaxID=37001 RepID=A0A1A9X0N7_9MUSC
MTAFYFEANASQCTDMFVAINNLLQRFLGTKPFGVWKNSGYVPGMAGNIALGYSGTDGWAVCGGAARCSGGTSTSSAASRKSPGRGIATTDCRWLKITLKLTIISGII